MILQLYILLLCLPESPVIKLISADASVSRSLYSAAGAAAVVSG